ncbi:carbohydrate ABC transporter permease [Amycolatopsis sp. NPDC049253]|jgi:putative aldouronate transport system permease protein|uniref:carbohydrate ABC transporter permease n=1 Tax=Amycolatopsis sp. NPDC049253 TaxID=3155274 RepID=UPI003435033E
MITILPTAKRTKPRTSARPSWEEKPTLFGQLGKFLSLCLVLGVILFPLYCVVITSFSTQASINIAGGIVVVPHGLTLDAYRQMLDGGVVTRAVIIALVITLAGTAISMVVSVLCAYGLSRQHSFGHRTILMTFIATMFFSGGLIPTFIVVANIFHGYDQYWALILPSAVSVFNILIIRSFYMNTARDLIDAAKIDGAGDWRILWSVVLPTSKAVNVVMALFYGVTYWNSWFNVLLYMPADNSKWPIQYVLYEYVNQGASMPGGGSPDIAGHAQPAPLSLQMAVVVLTLIPILIVYPFTQKHFAKGALTGAIKG